MADSKVCNDKVFAFVPKLSKIEKKFELSTTTRHVVLISFQLKLETVTTHPLLLLEKSWDNRSRFTVLPNSGHIVVKGQTGDNDHWSLHQYELKGGRIRKIREVNPTCQHNFHNPELLGMVVEGEELVAASCWSCGNIKLVNMETRESHTAYTAEHSDFMCHGGSGKIWLCLHIGTVIELNCQNKTFVETGKTFSRERSRHLCYLPAPQNALILCHASWMEAVSCETLLQMWEVRNVSENTRDPKGATLHPGHQQLVVTNSEIGELQLVDPVTGSIHQRIMSSTWGYIWDVAWNKDEFLFLHSKGENLQISQVQLIHPETGILLC